jgi:hypothetical protein
MHATVFGNGDWVTPLYVYYAKKNDTIEKLQLYRLRCSGSGMHDAYLILVPHDTSGAEVTVQGILHRTIVGPAINNQRTVTQRASAEAGRGSAPRRRAFVLPAPQPCTTTYDGCGGASMLSAIREGLEEAIEKEEMDWQMKNSPALTNTEQLLYAGRVFRVGRFFHSVTVNV